MRWNQRGSDLRRQIAMLAIRRQTRSYMYRYSVLINERSIDPICDSSFQTYNSQIRSIIPLHGGNSPHLFMTITPDHLQDFFW